ncbi:MAG TPA: UDP-N-acetylglucosamine--N-acetylmuramyl-(pentapeptide) pyrophosphoryl-undecaprenol N-acetylglucosamine transferase [Candidatus Paceibacterota bacterium]|nr:UDP-N-acetylglucosamine--N-acetylmuramyl-(pentapeptide) pyrophosphoryl-undecaprenol N-acetylglucosamine transferase [Candidatus Paceibacterota bacterium]
MTIVFTGGGTGGHFYPLIAIAEAMRDTVREKRLIDPKLYFLAPAPFDEKSLFEHGILFVKIPAGKHRRYASFENVTGMFTSFFGVLTALITLFRIYPDVVVSKGGYGSVPTTVAARFLRIPVIIHESDAKPGRANLYASKWARHIAISFPSAAHYFPTDVQNKIARTGIPIRKSLTQIEPEGARQYLGLEPGVPTIVVLGGSLGSVRINENIVSALPDLVSFATVIHQTGRDHLAQVQNLASEVLRGNPHANRYKPFDYLNELSMQRVAGVADVVISRAGSGAINEIAIWKKPAILIPIPEEVSHDQRTNAYTFAETGAAIVIEEANLTPHILASEAKRIATSPELAKSMGERAGDFADPDAARILAEEALSIGLSHEVS